MFQFCICSHSIAAAESNGLLKPFVKSYGAYVKTPKGCKSVTPNYTRLSMENLPRQTVGEREAKHMLKNQLLEERQFPMSIDSSN